MNCSKADYYFMKYMDNCLSKSEAVKLSKHLDTCEKCKRDFLIYDNLVKEFSTSVFIEAPEDFELNVMEKISKLEPSYVKAEKLTNTLLAAFLAVLGGVLSFGIVLFFNRDSILAMMSGYPELELYVSALAPVSGFVASFLENAGNIFISLSEGAALFLNNIKYLILFAAVSLFGIQYLLYKKEKDKVED